MDTIALVDASCSALDSRPQAFGLRLYQVAREMRSVSQGLVLSAEMWPAHRTALARLPNIDCRSRNFSVLKCRHVHFATDLVMARTSAKRSGSGNWRLMPRANGRLGQS